jgi:uncharacterized protein YjbI with pentapeptide repeats
MIFTIGILVILACLIIIIFLPRQQAKRLRNSDVEKRLAFENETRKTVIQILGGIAFFSTFYFSYKTYILSNEQQITNRFTETIRLLSDSNRDIRIGALYALERLCKDSEKDKISILQIINAYIRNRAPQSSKDILHRFVDSSLNKASSDDYSCSFYHPSNEVYVFQVDTTKQELDIQVAIAILGTNNSGQVPLNFTGLNLQGIDFRALDLSNSDFSYCDLTSDDFGKATIDSCKFNNVVANETNFAVTKMRKSSFENSLLQEANFYQADLSNSYIGGGACCYKCQFGEAVFINGKLENSVDLQRALFWDADLTNVSFEFANMDSANLDRTILKGADLSGTRGILKSELDKAKTDKTTKLP